MSQTLGDTKITGIHSLTGLNCTNDWSSSTVSGSLSKQIPLTTDVPIRNLIYEQPTLEDSTSDLNSNVTCEKSLISPTLSWEADLYEQSTIIHNNDGTSSCNDLFLNSSDDLYVDNVSPLCAQTNMLHLGLRGKGMHIGHLNVRGIRSKFDEIRIMLESSDNDIAILGLTESKLGPSQPNTAFQIPGFHLFRKDKRDGSGGLLTYVREDIICKHRENLESDSIESLWLEIFPKHCKSFLVGFIYRNPSSNMSWVENFDLQIEQVLDENRENLLLGDFNKDLFDVKIKDHWTEYMTALGFKQYVEEATRVIAGKSSTLIDHIYSNEISNIKFIDVPHVGISDHYPVFLTRKTRSVDPKLSHQTISYRSFKNFQEESFKNDLTCVPWDVIKIFENVDDAIDTWYKLFNEVVDKHIPFKQRRVKHQTQPKWFSPEIGDAIKNRDSLKSQGKETEYKTARNEVTKLIRLAKQKHYEKILENTNNNPQNVWKIFKEFGAGKGDINSRSTIFSINHNDEQIFDNKEVANRFNNFFISVAQNLKEPLDSTSHDRLYEYCDKKLKEKQTDYFEIPEISLEKVKKYLSTLDISKATGNDNVGPKLLRLAGPLIAESLCYLCNLSIHTSTFPSIWKEAKVKPLFKTGSRDDVNNYRPISILPILSKLLEKHVHDSLMNYLEKHELLCINQSGFRPNHSCETALVRITEKWLKALNEGEMVGVVLVDFKKAFDLVDHSILLNKMKAYQLSMAAIHWFSSYLSDRRQLVQINNDFSDREVITCGVPQGSILGPLLFLLFVNDLPLCTSNVITDLYADDTTLYDINRSVSVIEHNLSAAVKDVSTWSKQNGMVINFDKTKVMLITTRQKRDQLEIKSLNINVADDKYLNQVSCDKVLGVYVDENLSWSQHIKTVTTKMSRNIWLLSQISKYLSHDHRIIFYKSYIQPHIDYCNIVWGNCPKTALAKIERLQKRACKVILNYNYDEILQAMSNLNIMTVYERIFLRKAKFMYKVSANTSPLYVKELFRKRDVEDKTIPVLRSTTSDHFLLPNPKTELYRNSLSFTGPVIWNCLPYHIKVASSIDAFHKSCVQWMKSSYLKS